MLLSSCKKEHALSPAAALQATQFIDSTEYADEDDPSILGRHLPNPYTLENMNEALDSLQAQDKHSLYPVNIRITHRYIKFTPQTEAELEQLQNADFPLFDVPMDYEESVVGKFYREPGLSDGTPTPMYANVPIDNNLPNGVAYQVLAEMYMPEEDRSLLGASNENHSFAYSLLAKAEKLSGFIHMEPYDFNPYDNIGGPYYEPPGGTTPNGQIRIYDTRLGTFIGLEGVKVTAKRGLRVREAITNAQGNYYLDQGPFPSGKKVDYTIHMDRKHFVVKDNWLNPSKIKRNNIVGNYWSHDIELGYENMQGHLFRAAYLYFYKDIDGLKRPREIGKTGILAKNEVMGFAGHYNGFWDRIRVARYEVAQEEFLSDELFGITIHELAHLSHRKEIESGGLAYASLPSIIPESWAIAIQWHLTNKEYRGRGISDYGDKDYYQPGLRRPHIYAYQFWSPSYQQHYTTLFINLVDDFNELGYSFPSINLTGQINDNVAGYTLSGIESVMLKHIHGMGTLSQQLKNNKPAGVSDAQIDQLLNQYQ